MRGGGHRVLVGGQDVVGLGVVAVGIAGAGMAPAVGRGHREGLGGQDVVSGLAVKVPVALPECEGLGGQDVVGLVRIAPARHGLRMFPQPTSPDGLANNLSRHD